MCNKQDNDRWVRIIDQNHILRVDIDEEWHPAYGSHGWQPVGSTAGTAISSCEFSKFRCRLRDVPVGTKIVDPSENWELVDPWETKPEGYEEYWHPAEMKWKQRIFPSYSMLPIDIYRRPTFTKFPDQFAANTAAFRKACEASKTPQPGEWWFSSENQARAYIHGFDRLGNVIYELYIGGIYTSPNWNNWYHEPACTGWDWKPETKRVPLTLEQRMYLLEQRLNKLEVNNEQ